MTWWEAAELIWTSLLLNVNEFSTTLHGYSFAGIKINSICTGLKIEKTKMH